MIPLRALARHATGSRELVAVLSSILIVLALSLAIPINAARSPPGVAGANLAGPRPAAPSSQTPSQFTNTYCNLSRRGEGPRDELVLFLPVKGVLGSRRWELHAEARQPRPLDSHCSDHHNQHEELFRSRVDLLHYGLGGRRFMLPQPRDALQEHYRERLLQP